MMGIWATVAQQFQLDPPEADLMAKKRITLAMFGNDTNFLDCRLYDGVFQSMIEDIVVKIVSGDLNLVQCTDDSGSQQTLVTPQDIFQDKYDYSWAQVNSNEIPGEVGE